ncbi:MAG: hypothetical protein GY866_16275 [Proteobacteria bacterium]|nr:hypothetical protein [Pseudomonadota bacterium]
MNTLIDTGRIAIRIAVVALCILASVSLPPGSRQLSAYDKASLDRLRRSNTCAGCDLYKANLNGMDLAGANLRGANLAFARFRRATLYKADLSGADLRGADFEGALWIDGTICQKGSIGKCVRKTE